MAYHQVRLASRLALGGREDMLELRPIAAAVRTAIPLYM